MEIERGRSEPFASAVLGVFRSTHTLRSDFRAAISSYGYEVRSRFCFCIRGSLDLRLPDSGSP